MRKRATCHPNKLHHHKGLCHACANTLWTSSEKGQAWLANYKASGKQKEVRKLYKNTKYETDVGYRLAEILRARLRSAIKGNFRSGSAVRDLGCSIDFLKLYFETIFQPGMSWENQGEWHIDHIKPLSSFDLSDSEQLKQACHYTNLQPLWAKDNLKKGNK
jgi:hypothetical protein